MVVSGSHNQIWKYDRATSEMQNIIESKVFEFVVLRSNKRLTLINGWE